MQKALISLIILLCTLALNAQIEKDSGYIVQVGDKVPNIKLDLIDGTSIQLDDLKGKVVVLQFTASWCSVCRKEMPHLEKEIWLPNKDKEFILIVTYPMALDPGAEIFAKFANKRSGVTRNVVIDKEGNIAFLTRLYDKKEYKAMKKKINELLKE